VNGSSLSTQNNSAAGADFLTTGPAAPSNHENDWEVSLEEFKKSYDTRHYEKAVKLLAEWKAKQKA
jgi:hypothetical protein